MEQIARATNVPRFARKIISRPGKEAFEFMKNYGAEIWSHYQKMGLYYIVFRKKVYRVQYEGMPSALVRERFFKQWLEKMLAG